MNSFIPDRGDIVWLNFHPQRGHEQSGKRPALVLSPGAYNRKTGLLICCPITSKVKGYPFEVVLDRISKIEGVVLADQIKSLDWRARKASLAGRVGQGLLKEVYQKLETLINPVNN